MTARTRSPWSLKSWSPDSTLLGGSWLAISRVRSRVTIVITFIRGFITPLITTHEPPSRGLDALKPQSPKPRNQNRALLAV